MHDNTSSSGPSKPWQFVRLPKNVKPLSYDLWVLPDLETFTFRGTVDIQLEVTAATSHILVHAAELQIQSAELLDAAGNPRTLVDSFLYPENQFFVTQWRRRLAPGRYKLRLAFTGIINDELRGFYRSSYKDAAGEVHWVAVTQFQSSDFRRACPG